MASILEGSLAEDVAAALDAADVPYAVVVTRPGGEQPGENPWDPPIITDPVDYEGKGWRDQYQQDLIDGTLITASDLRIIILATSIPIVPTTSDTITIGGTEYVIVNVKRDPAGATFDVQARA